MSDDLLAKKRAPWEVEGATAAPIYPSSGLRLDPNDPFEAVLADIVETNRRKRHAEGELKEKLERLASSV